MIRQPEDFPQVFAAGVDAANEGPTELRLYCAVHAATALEADPKRELVLVCPEPDCTTAVQVAFEGAV